MFSLLPVDADAFALTFPWAVPRATADHDDLDGWWPMMFDIDDVDDVDDRA